MKDYLLCKIHQKNHSLDKERQEGWTESFSSLIFLDESLTPEKNM